MENQTLENRAEQRETQDMKSCAECGRKYDLQERKQETAHYPQPNTAQDYCTDICWATDIFINEE